MRDPTQPGDLPLRPLTTGELLDAAVVLLRVRARALIGIGATLALAEQVILFVLRRDAGLDASFWPDTGGLAAYGSLVIIGLFTETLCICLLAGVAGRVAPRALLGPAAPPREPSRMGFAALVAPVVAGVAAAAGWTFLSLPEAAGEDGIVLAYLVTALFWPFTYGLLGLAVPAVVVDRVGPTHAFVRSLRLAGRNGMRAAWIRVVGFAVWLFIRFGVGYGTIAIIGLFYDSPSATVDILMIGVAFLLVNCLAYPVLGCLDVALHLDSRMRTEGLDIALRRDVRAATVTSAALAEPR